VVEEGPGAAGVAGEGLLESRIPLWLGKGRKKIRLVGRITIDGNRELGRLPGVVACRVEVTKLRETSE
jgi:hypothetical protein